MADAMFFVTHCEAGVCDLTSDGPPHHLKLHNGFLQLGPGELHVGSTEQNYKTKPGRLVFSLSQ